MHRSRSLGTTAAIIAGATAVFTFLPAHSAPAGTIAERHLPTATAAPFTSLSSLDGAGATDPAPRTTNVEPGIKALHVPIVAAATAAAPAPAAASAPAPVAASAAAPRPARPAAPAPPPPPAPAPPPPPPAPTTVAGAEGRVVELINGERSRAGLAPLSANAGANNIARAWSNQMASRNSLSHNPNLASQVTQQVTPDWRSIAENIGYAQNVDQVHAQFMGSAEHRANILSGSSNLVGVGVVQSGGTVWVTVVFVGA